MVFSFYYLHSDKGKSIYIFTHITCTRMFLTHVQIVTQLLHYVGFESCLTHCSGFQTRKFATPNNGSSSFMYK